MKIYLHQEVESIEALGRGDLRLIQPIKGFRFGQDSVLLAHFAADLAKKSWRQMYFADLCAGSGIVGLLFAELYGKNKSKGLAVEIDEAMADILQRNIYLNPTINLDMAVGNIAEEHQKWKFSLPDPGFIAKHSFNLILMNPPYSVAERGVAGNNLIARQEIYGSLSAYVKCSADLLCPNGEMYISYRPERFDELLQACSRVELQADTLRFVQATPFSKPKLLLAKFRYKGKSGSLKWLPALYTSDQYSRELKEIYGEQENMLSEDLFKDIIITAKSERI